MSKQVVQILREMGEGEISYWPMIQRESVKATIRRMKSEDNPKEFDVNNYDETKIQVVCIKE